MRRAPLSAIAIALVLSGTSAQAMPIQVFDRMSADDRSNYIGVMIAGAEQVLSDAGQLEAAAKIKKLFTTVLPGDQVSVGSGELSLNLAAVTKAEADNLAKDPNAKPLAVELALIVTLKANGIILPRNFMRVGDNFATKKPMSPPPKFGPFAQCFAYRHGACASQ
jgi:hypothetical protein